MKLEDLFYQLQNMIDHEVDREQTSEEIDLQEVKEIFEDYISNYEEQVQDNVESQKVLKILKKSIFKANPIDKVLAIKRLSITEKRAIFKVIQKMDYHYNLDSYERHLKQLLKISKGKKSSDLELQKLLNYFNKLGLCLEVLQQFETEKLKETTSLLSQYFTYAYDIKKVYQKIQYEQIFLISESLENILCNHMNLTEDGKILMKRFIEHQNQQYQQALEEKRQKEEAIKAENERRNEELRLKQEQLRESKMSVEKEQEQVEILDIDENFEFIDVKDPDFEHNVVVYSNIILQHNDLSTLETLFPPKNIKKYDKLMNRIIECLKEEIEAYTLELKKASDPQLKQYIENHLQLEESKLKVLLKYYHVEENSIKVDNVASSRLFFATHNGKILLLEDLKDNKYLDQKNRLDVLQLLQKLQQEQFGNSSMKSRKIQNNEALSDVYEMKNYQTRLIYKRIYGNNYYVFMTFVKKDDNSLYDRRQIEHRVSLVMREYEMLKHALETGKISEAYLEEQNKIMEGISAMLSSVEEKKR